MYRSNTRQTKKKTSLCQIFVWKRAQSVDSARVCYTDRATLFDKQISKSDLTTRIMASATSVTAASRGQRKRKQQQQLQLQIQQNGVDHSNEQNSEVDSECCKRIKNSSTRVFPNTDCDCKDTVKLDEATEETTQTDDTSSACSAVITKRRSVCSATASNDRLLFRLAHTWHTQWPDISIPATGHAMLYPHDDSPFLVESGDNGGCVRDRNCVLLRERELFECVPGRDCIVHPIRRPFTAMHGSGSWCVFCYRWEAMKWWVRWKRLYCSKANSSGYKSVSSDVCYLPFYNAVRVDSNKRKNTPKSSTWKTRYRASCCITENVPGLPGPVVLPCLPMLVWKRAKSGCWTIDQSSLTIE